jgi:hypothetical protein
MGANYTYLRNTGYKAGSLHWRRISFPWPTNEWRQGQLIALIDQAMRKDAPNRSGVGRVKRPIRIHLTGPGGVQTVKRHNIEPIGPLIRFYHSLGADAATMKPSTPPTDSSSMPEEATSEASEGPPKEESTEEPPKAPLTSAPYDLLGALQAGALEEIQRAEDAEVMGTIYAASSARKIALDTISYLVRQSLRIKADPKGARILLIAARDLSRHLGDAVPQSTRDGLSDAILGLLG